jgi:hypothetical protein
MSNLRIDRLALRLSGVSEAEGRRLAQLLTEGWAEAGLPGAASGDVGALRVQITARPGDSMEWLARQITAEVRRQLERSI